MWLLEIIINMKTILKYLERQYVISNPPFEEPFEMVDDDTIPDQLSGVTYEEIKYGEN